MNAAGMCKTLDDVGRFCAAPITEVNLGSVTALPREGNSGNTFWIDDATGASLNALGLPNPGLQWYRAPDARDRRARACVRQAPPGQRRRVLGGGLPGAGRRALGMRHRHHRDQPELPQCVGRGRPEAGLRAGSRADRDDLPDGRRPRSPPHGARDQARALRSDAAQASRRDRRRIGPDRGGRCRQHDSQRVRLRRRRTPGDGRQRAGRARRPAAQAGRARPRQAASHALARTHLDHREWAAYSTAATWSITSRPAPLASRSAPLATPMGWASSRTSPPASSKPRRDPAALGADYAIDWEPLPNSA